MALSTKSPCLGRVPENPMDRHGRHARFRSNLADGHSPVAQSTDALGAYGSVGPTQSLPLSPGAKTSLDTFGQA